MRINELISASQPRNMAKSHFEPDADLTGLYPDEEFEQRQFSRHIKEFIKKLEEKGFQQTTLGYGIRGVVFQRPNDPYVIKMFYKDASYRKFLDVCLKNQSNPYFPKLRGKPVMIAPDTYVVRMERLHPVWGENKINLDEKSKALFMEIQAEVSNPADGFENSTIENMAPELQEFFVKMGEAFGPKMLLDIHIGNIMARSSSQLVIIDPVIS